MSPAYLHLMPSDAVSQPIERVLETLERQYGSQFYTAFEANHYPGPVSHALNCNWIKSANTVGINVRTLGDFWSIVPYAMTLPTAQNAIHLLPIFEPGVVSSLYGPTSWNINPEFYSPRLAQLFPHLNTVETQLSLVVRLLHLLGKAVGMDVIPHMDRFAEPVLANPSHFEWIQRHDMQIVQHHDTLYLDVRALLFEFLQKRGSVEPGLELPETAETFFEGWPENLRLRLMFGEKHQYQQRLDRRIEMVDLLYAHGYETLPATMGPPYRGIEVDPDPDAKIIDEAGRIWRDYRITRPEKFSRVFGPLARFKLYETHNHNADWALDFHRPYTPAWQYVCDHYAAVQATFDFDFMRGDMSHVQMRPDGTPAHPDAYYDLLGAVKQFVLPQKPYFGYFAESFLAPPGEMAYGDECDHLEASLADTTLGDLQSEPVGTPFFIRELHRYDALLRTRRFAPNFTIMTADKDDPRFDAFYLNGNETRHFIALFLTDMPSYMGLGFECRDPHPTPAPNEHYTKLYVFQVQEGAKSTKGAYVWGKNQALYAQLVRQKMLSETIGVTIKNAPARWLLAPDPQGERSIIAWTQATNPAYVFLANLNQTEHLMQEVVFPEGVWDGCFHSNENAEMSAVSGIVSLDVPPGGCMVWQLRRER
jgi:hypothetical protein